MVKIEPGSALILLNLLTHPVCAEKERDHFISRADTPPWKGGECHPTSPMTAAKGR